MVVSQAATEASTAAGTVSWPPMPTISAAKSTEENRSRVHAAMPAAAPTATATAGDCPKTAAGIMATATPMKIAGNRGPPRKPQPRLTA